MRLTGALVTHYHPDHVGGEHDGLRDRGHRRAARARRRRVPRCTCRREEALGVKRVTGCSDSDLVLHESGDVVRVGDDPDHADPHAGPHAGQPVLLRRRPARGGRHAVPRRLRPHRPPRRRPRSALREPHPEARGRPRRRRALSRATSTRPSRRCRWARSGTATYVFRPRTREQWMMMFGHDGY